MKTALHKALPLLLCLILCICLAPAAWAEETDEILIMEDHKSSLPTDDSFTLSFELSDAEVFFAAGDPITVSFDGNGADGGAMEPQVFYAGVKQQLTKNTFTREGYIFTGWNAKADGSGQQLSDDGNITIFENYSSDAVTLYAQWVKRVIVYLDPNGASGDRRGQAFRQGVTGKLVTMERIGYTRDDYEFVCWATVSDAAPTDPRIIPDNGEFTAESDTTLYAIWKKVPGISIDKAHFPDGAFRSYVSANLDQNGDGELSKSDIAAVTQINVSGRYNEPGAIRSLEGIQYFTALQRLYCSYNRLTSLDVSQNTALNYLNCANNQLTNLDVSNNTALTSLYCFSNQLVALDISACPHLVALIETVNPTIRNPYIEFREKLSILSFDLNVTLTPALSFGPGIAIDENAFPDPVFRDYVRDFDIDKNDEISDTEINAVSQIILPGNYQESGMIKSLEGIQHFSNLTTLQCGYNQLTSLDVSHNITLKALYCSSNQLTSLDVSNNTALETLYCSSNQLTSLDVSSNTALSHLLCDNNPLSALDVSQCPILTDLVEDTLPSVQSNSTGTVVTFSSSDSYRYSLRFDQGVNLTPAIDFGPGIVFSNAIFPDPIFLDYVRNFDIDRNGVLSDTETNLVTNIDVHSLNITSLQGIELFPNLTNLYCRDNQLTSLDISDNIALTNLYCDNNQLTCLDLSSNTALVFLSCANNRLTGLDLSQNTALIGLSCEGNYLTVLDLSNSPFLSMVYNAFDPQYVDNAAEYHFKDYGVKNGPISDDFILFYDIGTSIITAPGLVLPAALTEIGEEAFADSAFRYATVPDTVTVIGPRAFADCHDLAAVYIPESATDIAPDAFSGITNLLVVGIPNSAAYNYTRQNGFRFVAPYLQ